MDLSAPPPQIRVIVIQIPEATMKSRAQNVPATAGYDAIELFASAASQSLHLQCCVTSQEAVNSTSGMLCAAANQRNIR